MTKVNRKRFLLIVISIILILTALGLVNIFLSIGRIETYDLQLGQKEDDEFPQMLDNGTSFKNDTTLIAMAIFPDKKKNLLSAKLYVTKKGDTKVIQEEFIRVTEYLAGYPLRLENLKWSLGEYTLYFKIGSEIEKSIDFTLK